MVRSPMQVDDNFRMRIKKIQELIMRKQGKFKSIPSITNEMSKMPELDMIEQKLLGDVQQIEFSLKFDKRVR